jgi:glycosyltransferase involved in cell wall biosynthesis
LNSKTALDNGGLSQASLADDRGVEFTKPPQIVGFVESISHERMIGWAFDRTSESPLTLRLTIDDVEVATTLCADRRADVMETEFAREFVGFSLAIPAVYCDGQRHVARLLTHDGRLARLRLVGGGERDEWEFNFARESARSGIDPWYGRDVRCWAVIRDNLTRETRPADHVIVRQSGEIVATLFPTVSRPDVAAIYDGAGECGFVLAWRDLWRLDRSAPLHFHSPPDDEEIVGSPLDLSMLEAEPEAITWTPSAAATVVAPAWTPGGGDGPAGAIEALARSGLFDEAYYRQTYPDLAHADIPLFDHFYEYGFREGRRPNAYFDPIWYMEQNPDVDWASNHPLVHYFLHGDAEGRDPCALFHSRWYRDRYGIQAGHNTLAHYLRHRFETPLSPHAGFDADYYATKSADVFAARIDMFEHFLHYGYRELRNPSAEFDVKYYTQRYLKGDQTTNPLIHFWAHRHEPGVHGRMPDDEPTIAREVKRFCRPGPYFEEIESRPSPLRPQVMLLAYYLPQFHAFPENDAWWGTGFTEWTNLVRGLPRFVGHYQPRVPRDLGFYTLDSNEPMRRQIKLAVENGVSGFVFYYYWFNGKRLMDQPVRRFLDDTSLDIKFALMWANENWTRRWDGAESEVLISQDYRPDDDRAMAADFALHFKDRRYIRLQGRPVLMIYRAAIIPDCKLAIERWRTIFREDFQENPIFVMAQAFTANDPSEFGFDGAIEFPPHKLTLNLAPANAQFTLLDVEFSGNIHRYESLVDISLGETHPRFPLIKTAVPSWDNDARRQGGGMALAGSTPAKYEAWLSSLVQIAKANPFFGEPIVCVNAWNEWCEGAYLEPDLHFGGAYLNATARAVAGRPRSVAIPRMVLVGHDAFPSGAQHLLLNIGRVLRSGFGIDIEFVLLGGGEMAADYARQGPVTIIESDAQFTDKLRRLAESGFTGAIVNTTASGRSVPYLKAAGIRPILLAHELPRILREKQLTAVAKVGVTESAFTVFSSRFARDVVLDHLGLADGEHCLIIPQGSYKDIRFDPEAGAAVRAELGLRSGDHLVLGVGYADLRKGFDLFVQLWRLLRGAWIGDGAGRICLAWVGGIDPGLADWLAVEIASAEATGTFKMAGYRTDMAAVLSAASAFVLTSREDPLPTVVMEALGAGLPVVAFDRSGGIPDMLRQIDEGAIAPYGDTAAMARAILTAIEAGISPDDRKRRHAKITKEYNFPDYVARLVDLALPDLARVSVAVPNYNYAQYLPSRLGSIFDQAYPVREVLVLDDCSKDDSLIVIPRVAREANRAIRLVANEKNSGSVFVQWRRAAEMATGEFIWIAEADDLSDPDFLTRATALLNSDPNVRLAFTDSRAVDGDGTPIWDSYKGYYATMEPGALTRTEVFGASEFVRRFLSVKNLILNVSAVVWRRDALLEALEACAEDLSGFRMAGDWLLYLTALSAPGARVGYEARPLNVHRRHAQSVTHALHADRHLAEIALCHDVAARAFALPEDVGRKQADYLAEVKAQLGVGQTTVAPPRPSDSPTGEKGESHRRLAVSQLFSTSE